METRLGWEDTTEQEKPLLGLPSSSEFALLSGYHDPTLMRAALGAELARRSGQYAPRSRFVELYYSQVHTPPLPSPALFPAEREGD